ncbi:hypothetical protein ACIBBE_24940 [Streptomyces sp. NPDC051644]|uniref:hypothetical protein n=1 Tax=Streptomyces sp. NPDC051644 TaxID=3365666 RepID=UPI00379C8457
MRQSTARTTQTWLYLSQVHIEANPYVPIAGARRVNLERVVAQARSRGRDPRVCLYALSFDEQVPRASLDSAAAYARRKSWQVGSEQSFTDPDDATAPQDRPGWGHVRKQIRAGFADGVVVITADVVSSEVDEYRDELAWFEEHHGFIALVIPEITTERT